jgi:hypothetical protein
MVALENITKNGAWFANCAGGIPPILQDITTNGSMRRLLLREAVVGLRPPQRQLQQPWLVSHQVAH